MVQAWSHIALRPTLGEANVEGIADFDFLMFQYQHGHEN